MVYGTSAKFYIIFAIILYYFYIIRIILKTRQYSVKVFEIELVDETEFIAFFDKNYQFFQNHLIVIYGRESRKIKEYLISKKLNYLFNIKLPKKNSSEKVVPSISTQKVEPKREKHLKVVDQLIRSGQELNVDGDLLLLNRVNSGGSIIVHGTLVILQVVDGSIRCDGNFMMLQASPKANIVFHDVEVDNKYLQEKLSRVELINNEIVITPAIKETSWV